MCHVINLIMKNNVSGVSELRETDDQTNIP